MSELVSELSQIIERILVVAPTDKKLKEFFEILAFEASNLLNMGKDLDLKMGAPSTGPISAWMSLTLGYRTQFAVRLHFIGHSLDKTEGLLPPLDFVDSMLFWTEGSEADRFITYPWSKRSARWHDYYP